MPEIDALPGRDEAAHRRRGRQRRRERRVAELGIVREKLETQLTSRAPAAGQPPFAGKMSARVKAYEPRAKTSLELYKELVMQQPQPYKKSTDRRGGRQSSQST